MFQESNGSVYGSDEMPTPWEARIQKPKWVGRVMLQP